MSVHVRRFRHETGSASVRDRKKSRGSGSMDWRIRSSHISDTNPIIIIAIIIAIVIFVVVVYW